MADFGTDLSALRVSAGSVVESSENLVEALTRRLQTPKGSLFYDEEYGTRLHDWIGEGISDDGVGVAVTVETDLEEDPRVRSAYCAVLDVNQRGIRLEVSVETAEGPFVLTVDASLAGVTVYPDTHILGRGEG